MIVTVYGCECFKRFWKRHLMFFLGKLLMGRCKGILSKCECCFREYLCEWCLSRCDCGSNCGCVKGRLYCRFLNDCFWLVVAVARVEFDCFFECCWCLIFGLGFSIKGVAAVWAPMDLGTSGGDDDGLVGSFSVVWVGRFCNWVCFTGLLYLILNWPVIVREEEFILECLQDAWWRMCGKLKYVSRVTLYL